jgi:type I restriction enzyme, S subunit
LFYYFESQYEELRKLSAGDGGRGGLNLKIIKNVNVIVPIKLEQSKVAAILFTWDRAIELKEKLLKQKKLQKKGLMERLLTGKVRLPGFNDEWKKKRIKELLVLSERPIQLHDDMQYEQITIRRNYGGVESRGSSFGRKILVTSQFLVWQNDFVISRRQIAHGACGVVPLELDGAIVSNEYDVFTACADLDVHFFSYLMQLPIFKYKFYVYSNGVHIEKMIFHTYAWLKVEIKLPDYEEQVRIREIIDKRQMESDLLNQEITQLKLQKKGLMQLLLTGKVRVHGGGV